MKRLPYRAILALLVTSSNLAGQTVVVEDNLVFVEDESFPPFNDSLGSTHRATIYQDSAGGDPTSAWFNFDGVNLAVVSVNLDEGSDWYLVHPGDPFGFAALANSRFTPIFTVDNFLPPVVIDSDEFYLGVSTTGATREGISEPYCAPNQFLCRNVFGWVRLRNVDNRLEMVDNAVAYGSVGIIVGTTDLVPEPNSAAIGLVICPLLAAAILFKRRRVRFSFVRRDVAAGAASVPDSSGRPLAGQFKRQAVLALWIVLAFNASRSRAQVPFPFQLDRQFLLSGFVTNDIRIDFAGQYTGAEMILRLDNGTIHQDALGGNTPPNGAVVAAFPNLTWDTFFAQGGTTSAQTLGEIALGDGAVNLGGDSTAELSDTVINQAWGPAEGTVIENESNFLVARVTLSQDASGSFSFVASENGNLRRPLTLSITTGFLDNIWLGLLGDYNGNGIIEQADLDLVLLNWGAPAEPVPDGWHTYRPIGVVDQDELDLVLLNWGTDLSFFFSVPEPAAWLLAALVVLAGPKSVLRNISQTRENSTCFAN